MPTRTYHSLTGKALAAYHKKEEDNRKKAKLSESQKQSIKKAFPWISFKMNKAVCTYYGFGDQVGFEIIGKIKSNPKYKVIYRTKTYLTSPSIKVYDPDSKRIIKAIPVFYNSSSIIHEKVKSKISEFKTNKSALGELWNPKENISFQTFKPKMACKRMIKKLGIKKVK